MISNRKRLKQRILALLSEREMSGVELCKALNYFVPPYVTLRLMESEGLIVSRWGESTYERDGRQRCYYRLVKR